MDEISRYDPPENVRKSWIQSGWTMLGDVGVTTTDGRRVASDGDLLSEYLTNDVFYWLVEVTAAAIAAVQWRLFSRSGSPTAKRYKGQDLSLSSASCLVKSRKANWVQKAAPASSDTAEHLATSRKVVEITDHPLLDLLGQENSDLTPVNLRYMTAVYLLVFGGSYFLIEGAGLPVAIKVLPAYRIRAYRRKEDDIVAYLYYPLVGLSNPDCVLPANQVMPIRMPAPQDPYAGRNPAGRSCFEALRTAGEYQRYQTNVIDTRAVPGGIFIPEAGKPLTADKRERLQQQWDQRFGRTGNGRVLIADAPGTFTPTGPKPQDIGELKISDGSIIRAARAFGVPLAMMGDGATFANQSGAAHLHAKHTVLPQVLRIEQALNSDLVRRYGEDLFLAAENPVPRDEAGEIQKTTLAIQAGVLTRNEIRSRLGFDQIPVAGADDVPWDRQDQAQALTEGSGSSDAARDKPHPAAAMPALPSPPPEVELGETKKLGALLQINRMVAARKLERSVAIALASRQTGEREEVVRGLINHSPITKSSQNNSHALPLPVIVPPVPAGKESPVAARYVDKIRAYFEKQSNEWGILDNYIPSPAEMSHDDEALLAILMALWEEAEVEEVKQITPLFKLTTPETELAKTQAMAETQTLAMQYARMINTTTRDRVRAALEAQAQVNREKEEIAANSPAAKLQSRRTLEELFAAFGHERAITIAGDQAYRARQLAQISAARITGVVTDVIWQTAGDERVCPICGALQGEKIKLGKKFMGAQDPIESPPAHVNCRCWLVYLTSGGDLLYPEDIEPPTDSALERG